MTRTPRPHRLRLPIEVTLPAHVITALTAAAAQIGISRSRYLEHLILEACAELAARP